MAATNRVDILDPAILRPGRFDRRVVVGPPDVMGREEILKVHAKNKPLAEDVDLKQIAQTTAGFTGAELENLLNEAAIMRQRTAEDLCASPISSLLSSKWASVRRSAVKSFRIKKTDHRIP